MNYKLTITRSKNAKCFYILYTDDLPQKRRQAVLKDCQETRQRDIH